MSHLPQLREALVKLEAAEQALLEARNTYRRIREDWQPGDYEIHQRLDGQFEVVGDAANIVRDILATEEKKTYAALKTNQEPD